MTASGTGLGYGEGDESYGYDSCGYLKAQSAGRHRISEETDQYAGGHRLKQAGNTQYDYDAAGRMVSRTRHRDGYRPETERFRWDSRDQLTGYCSAQGEQWEYRHDASGRRTEKRCDRKKIRFTYLWDGDSIAEIREYRDDKLYSVRHLVFNGFELISQQFSRVRQPHPSVAPQWVTRTNHAVSDLTGRPLMLFNRLAAGTDQPVGAGTQPARRHRLPGPARGTGPGSRPWPAVCGAVAGCGIRAVL